MLRPQGPEISPDVWKMDSKGQRDNSLNRIKEVSRVLHPGVGERGHVQSGFMIPGDPPSKGRGMGAWRVSDGAEPGPQNRYVRPQSTLWEWRFIL